MNAALARWLVVALLLGMTGHSLAWADAGKTLVVGSEEDYPPFAIGKAGEPAGGFTVELWKAVAEQNQLQYTIRVRPFREILQEFRSGEVDVLINLAQSDERRRFADFSVPHVTVKGAIFVRKAARSTIRSEEDLTGKAIIVLNADLAHDYAVSRGWGRQLVPVDTAAEGLALLARGKHDAMLLSKLVGIQTVREMKLSNIVPVDQSAGFSQKFSFAVRKGNSDLLAQINEGLALTKASGVYDELYQKWFGVYEERVSYRYLLKYLVPAALLLLGLSAFAFYQRQRAYQEAASQRTQALETVRRIAKEEEANRFINSIIDSTPDPISVIDRQHRWVIVNDAFCAFVGHSREELIGKSAHDVFPKEEADASFEKDELVFTSGQMNLSEEFLSDAAGAKRWVQTKKIKHIAANGEQFIVAAIRDMTEQKALQEGLEFQAHVDYLTGLPNRRHFLELAELELARTLRNGIPFSALMLDIDHFKKINDTYGHRIGDLVLQKLSEVCRKTLRDIDVIGRWGGEEFAILLPGSDGKQAREVAERLRQRIAEAKVQLERGLPLRITVSIGVAPLAGKDANIEVLLNEADQALYAAKRAGRNKVIAASA
jgi:diguanylate cyclase (GGDEF)-like protein/PAS domain S-box-containing protein